VEEVLKIALTLRSPTLTDLKPAQAGLVVFVFFHSIQLGFFLLVFFCFFSMLSLFLFVVFINLMVYFLRNNLNLEAF
jgi:hypothetical protein